MMWVTSVPNIHPETAYLTKKQTEKCWYEITLLNQKDLTDTYRTFHLRKEEHAHFVAVCGTFTTADPISGTQSKSQ